MTKPRILGLDIETVPGEAYVWRLGEQYVGVPQLIRPARIIMVGAKWLGERGKVKQLDERSGHKAMIRWARDLIEEADAVVTYNGDSFDLPWLAGHMVEYDIGPMPPVTSIDLYKTVKKFKFMSRKLGYVAPLLKIGKKVEGAGYQLWLDCLAGLGSAWDRMTVYNAQDVRLLETGYNRLRPYVQNHPYLGTSGQTKTLPESGAACPRCNSKHAQRRGSRRTRAFIIHRLQCLGCGGWFDGSRERVKT